MSLSWSGVKEEEMKMTQITLVYVQPGNMYLSISAKTSSVWNIVVNRTWLVYVTGKYWNKTPCVPGIHLLQPSSYTPVTLTDCSQPHSNWRGRGSVTHALFTAHNWGSPEISHFDNIKKTVQKTETKNLKTVTFPNRGIPWKPVIVPCLF